MVADLVLDIFLTRADDRELAGRVVGVEIAVLGAGLTAYADEEILLAFRLADTEEETFVLLVINEEVFLVRLTETVAEDLERPPGVVGDRVEKGLVVIGPLERGRGAGDDVVEQLSGLEVFDADYITLTTGGIDTVGEELMIGADIVYAQAEEVLTFGELVDIEKDLFHGLQRSHFAAIDVILFALFGARVIVVVIALDRDGEVGFLDAAEHFVVEVVLELFGVRGHFLGVFVFGLEVGDNLWVILAAEPVVVVDAFDAEGGVDYRFDFGHGRNGVGAAGGDYGAGNNQNGSQ